MTASSPTTAVLIGGTSEIGLAIVRRLGAGVDPLDHDNFKYEITVKEIT